MTTALNNENNDVEVTAIPSGNGNKTIKKLRVLIISMGGERQATLESIFTSSSYEAYFETPVFTPGCPSRSIRSRSGLLQKAKDVGLIPPSEWEAIHSSLSLNEKLGNLLSDTPILENTQLQNEQRKEQQHYSEELWYKSRSIGRERSVLACIFAHMCAMKRCVEEGFDVILEDNVRPLKDGRLCYEYMNKIKEETILQEKNNNTSCDLLYYGWLGSTPSVEWVYNTYKQRYSAESYKSVLPFPADSKTEEVEGNDVHPIWGAYAYWVSQKGYEIVLEALQTDIGSFLWKSKRMKNYKVKPIDKILPRRINDHSTTTTSNVWITSTPCFFRAPMLCSTIHPQWDVGFCQSTERQLRFIDKDTNNGEVPPTLDWDDIFLEDKLLRVVQHRKTNDAWLPFGDIIAHQEQQTKEESGT